MMVFYAQARGALGLYSGGGSRVQSISTSDVSFLVFFLLPEHAWFPADSTVAVPPSPFGGLDTYTGRNQ